MFLFAILASCVNEDVSIEERSESIVDYVDPEVIKTPEDIRKANAILQVTRTLRKIYKDPMIVEEVNAAIATGYYEDETVLIKDLLDPANSPIYQLPSFNERNKSRGFKPGSFKNEFEKELGVSFPIKAKTEDLYYTDNGISIYFPYHEDTQYSTYPVTVLAATVESDRAAAQHPLCDDLNATTFAYCNQTVMVSDDYASVNPTHITGMGATVSNNTTNQSCQGAIQVKLGYIKVSGRQYDKLIAILITNLIHLVRLFTE